MLKKESLFKCTLVCYPQDLLFYIPNCFFVFYSLDVCPALRKIYFFQIDGGKENKFKCLIKTEERFSTVKNVACGIVLIKYNN